MGFIDFTTGQVLTADQMDLVMRQSVMRFADAATRDTALTEVLAEGMICYLDDTNEVLKYDSTDWIAIDPATITTQGDIIVGDAGGDASRLAIGTAGQILESDGTALSYVTPDSSPDDIITTQGDLIIGDASANAARIAIGAADTVLTSDGTTATWEAAGGGGGETLIASGTLGAVPLSLTSIPQTFTHLRLRLLNVETSTLNATLELGLNGITTNVIATAGTSASGSAGAGANTFITNQTFSTAFAAIAETLPPDTDPLSGRAMIETTIFSYSKTNLVKLIDSEAAYGFSDSGNYNFGLRKYLANVLPGISSLSLDVSTGNFSDGTYELYGVK